MLPPDTILHPSLDTAAVADTTLAADSIAEDTVPLVQQPTYYVGDERTFSQSTESNTWLFLVLAFLTLYIGVQRLWAYGEFRKRIRAMFNLRLANQYFREE